MPNSLNRRAFVGAVAVSGAGLLAGCGGPGGETGGEETPTPTEAETDTPTETGASGAVDEYLADTDNYDGSLQDETGSDSVSVDVGAEGNGGNFAFEPAAVQVDTGTTVTWVWTGEGGQHNVVDEDGQFESELVGDSGFEFEYTFEEAGTYLYYCDPHRGLGMKGAVVVE